LKYQPIHPRKNDFFFAFLLAAVFAVTIVGEVAGVVSVARRADTEVAKARQAPAAARSVGEQAPLLARAGARR